MEDFIEDSDDNDMDWREILHSTRPLQDQQSPAEASTSRGHQASLLYSSAGCC